MKKIDLISPLMLGVVGFLLAIFGILSMVRAERVESVLTGAKVIYKLEGGRYEQITDIRQIKDGVYIIIR